MACSFKECLLAFICLSLRIAAYSHEEIKALSKTQRKNGRTNKLACSVFLWVHVLLIYICLLRLDY